MFQKYSIGLLLRAPVMQSRTGSMASSRRFLMESCSLLDGSWREEEGHCQGLFSGALSYHLGCYLPRRNRDYPSYIVNTAQNHRCLFDSLISKEESAKGQRWDPYRRQRLFLFRQFRHAWCALLIFGGSAVSGATCASGCGSVVDSIRSSCAGQQCVDEAVRNARWGRL